MNTVRARSKTVCPHTSIALTWLQSLTSLNKLPWQRSEIGRWHGNHSNQFEWHESQSTCFTNKNIINKKHVLAPTYRPLIGNGRRPGTIQNYKRSQIFTWRNSKQINKNNPLSEVWSFCFLKQAFALQVPVLTVKLLFWHPRFVYHLAHLATCSAGLCLCGIILLFCL